MAPPTPHVYSRVSGGLKWTGGIAARHRGHDCRAARYVNALRHAFATHLFDAGVDPHTLQLLLGHRSIKTTLKYVHVSRHHLMQVRSPLDLLCFETANILRRFGPSYAQAHAVPPFEQRLIDDLLTCRTARLGGHLERCTQCGFERQAYHSCRNRHGPGTSVGQHRDLAYVAAVTA